MLPGYSCGADLPSKDRSGEDAVKAGREEGGAPLHRIFPFAIPSTFFLSFLGWSWGREPHGFAEECRPAAAMIQNQVDMRQDKYID